MRKRSLSQQLDDAIQTLVTQRASAPSQTDAKLAELVRVAEALRHLPREDFKQRLKADLERRITMPGTAQSAQATSSVRPIPKGFHTATPFLFIRDAARAMEFYKNAFGATEVLRMQQQDGKIAHGEMKIGEALIMLGEENPATGSRSPQSLGGTSVDLHLYVEDADAWAERAVAAGAKVRVPIADQDYGERHGMLEDPFGFRWGISTPLHEERTKQVRDNFYIPTPYLMVAGGAKAIEFYKKAFGATELMRLADPEGRINHAEIRIGDSLIMVADEAPDYGRRAPQSYGGVPVGTHLYVEDVDAMAKQAIGAGATVVRPVRDEFYGDRGGVFADPFGHIWGIGTHKEDVSPEELRRRAEALGDPHAGHGAQQAPAANTVKPIPEGYHTVTPYITVQHAAELIEFVKRAFGATETFRTTGSAGGLHAEVKIGDSMLMMGGSPGMEMQEMPTALHYYVADTDAVYQRALQSGATSIQPPADQEYGERSASVKDPFGNNWYIATHQGAHYIPEGLQTLNVYLHPRSAAQQIDFLTRALGGEEVARHAGPDLAIVHAKVGIGDSVIEMGEAHGPYQPMPTMLYLYVEDVDGLYQRAVRAGGTSMQPPTDQPYGDRTAHVKDAFGNSWYIATHVKDVAM